MSDDLYNVVIRYEYSEPPEATCTTSKLGAAIGQTANIFAAHLVRSRAQVWLAEQDRQRDLVNVYDNQADGLLFKFRSRETALLFRLSL